MPRTQKTPLKQANSYLIFWAIQGYHEVTTSPVKNLFSIRTNAIINLVTVVRSVYKYGDFSNKEVITAITNQFITIDNSIAWLRANYNPKIEENTSAGAILMIEYNKKLDSIYLEIIDIIIHLKLIAPQTLELIWKDEGDETNDF